MDALLCVIGMATGFILKKVASVRSLPPEQKFRAICRELHSS